MKELQLSNDDGLKKGNGNNGEWHISVILDGVKYTDTYN
jgi:hypothetical protein